MNGLPLANYRSADAPVLLGSPSAVGTTLAGTMRAADFFARASALAAALPEAAFVINLCETRAGFMLGFAAALLRGQVSLLPAGQGRSDWERLLRDYPGAYLLVDNAVAGDAATGHFSRFDLTALTTRGADIGADLQIPLISVAQTAAILFTSGSTGQPTPHHKSWGQLCRGAAALAAALGWAEAPACTVVGSVPPQHMFGLEATVMLPWYVGIPVHAQRPQLAADLGIALAAGLAQSGLPSWWMTTAIHMRAPLGSPAQMPGLQGVLASAMAVPVGLAIAAEAAWQVPVMEIYGSTETGALAIRRTASESTWLPLPGVVVWNEPAVSTATDPEPETQYSWASAPHVVPAVRLGDLLQLLPDGRLLLGGRANDLVKVGGKRTSLVALNQSLCEVPGVDEGCYFFPGEGTQSLSAANDESSAAQRPIAFYVSRTLSPPQVVAALRARIDPVFIPRPLYRVEKLPRNANGKLPQAALAALLADCKSKRAAVTAPDAPMMIAADHPALPGHFPGEPIVPGVVILACVAEAIRTRYPRLELGVLLNTRFHAPLKPEQKFSVQLRFQLQLQPQDERLRFEVHAMKMNAELIVSGLWACRAATVGAAMASPA